MKIFLISDNHFGSEEVINYFNRINPETDVLFKDANEMDALMIERWNKTVKSEDIVFSIGDFTWSGDWKRPAHYWWEASQTYQYYLDQLHGQKILVHGNHDPWNKDPWEMGNNILQYKGRMFYLTHDPGWGGEKIPKNWSEWVIHGHHHWVPDYTDPKKTFYPFIDGKRKNVNVACEVVNYTPVSLDWLLSLDINTILRMETVTSKEERSISQ